MKIYENKDLLVISKPCGLATIPPSKGIKAVSTLFPKFFPVHRLDSPTSGLLILAKSSGCAAYMIEQFKKRKVLKAYVGISDHITPYRRQVVWEDELVRSDKKNGPVILIAKNESVQSLHAKTHVDLYPDEMGTLLMFKPHTGRTHQLRVQSYHHGYALLGDNMYKGKTYLFLCLHALALQFKDRNGKDIKLFSPPQHWKRGIEFEKFLQSHHPLQ